MKRFRMTVWPAEGLPHPTTWNQLDYRLLDDLPVIVRADREMPWKPVPCDTDEIYLELCAVDLDDPGAILAFVNRWGILGLRDGPPGDEWAALREDRVGSIEHHVPRLEKSRASVASAVAAATGLPVGASSYWETLDEFRYGASLIRDMASANEWLTADDVTAIKFESAGFFKGSPSDNETTAIFLSNQLAPGLRLFHPTIQPEFFGSVNPGPSIPQNLYATCCLEIFNHVASGESYRHCANEPCGRRFMRQRGRSEVGQKRASGVLYCSKSCAQAQASRQNRRRNRAKLTKD